MSCFDPKKAYNLLDWPLKEGERMHLSFKEPGMLDRYEVVMLPCGDCVGCCARSLRDWVVRCTHESQLYEFNSFLTLTYNEKSLPPDRSLEPRDIQKFFYRLRVRLRKQGVFRISYYVAGEYGGKLGRPHYHILLFGYDFPDKKFFRKSASGHDLFTSAELESIWNRGYCPIGAVNEKTVAYCCQYVYKKYDHLRYSFADSEKKTAWRLTLESCPDRGRPNSDVRQRWLSVYRATLAYARSARYSYVDPSGNRIYRCPEFHRTSLKPALGRKWLERYLDDVYNLDKVVLSSGYVCRPPLYYDKLLNEWDPIRYVKVKDARKQVVLDSLRNDSDSIYDVERLKVKEESLKLSISATKRQSLKWELTSPDDDIYFKQILPHIEDYQRVIAVRMYDDDDEDFIEKARFKQEVLNMIQYIENGYSHEKRKLSKDEKTLYYVLAGEYAENFADILSFDGRTKISDVTDTYPFISEKISNSVDYYDIEEII